MFKYLLSHDSTGNHNIQLKKITIIISICIVIMSIILSPIIIPIMFPKYLDVVEVIQIMSIGTIPGTLSVIYTSKLLGQEKSKFVLSGSLLSLGTIIIGIITLGNILGIIGIGIAFLLASSFKAIFLINADRLFTKKMI